MSAFLRAFDHYTQGFSPLSPGHCTGCEECGEDPDVQSDEFSREDCEACGSRLAGEQHYAHATALGPAQNEGEFLHFSICTDCLYFVAYGDEPEGWAEAHDERIEIFIENYRQATEAKS
jgi:hypothetical protein